jgi:hypothetical protein
MVTQAERRAQESLELLELAKWATLRERLKVN